MTGNADCTLFNAVYDPKARADQWQNTYLKGVFWEDCRAASIVKGGLQPANGVMVYIPFSVEAGGNAYKKSKEFQKDPSNSFTLKPGDMLVKGFVEYTGNISKLAEVFDDVITITSVDTMDYGTMDMQHWEVSGK